MSVHLQHDQTIKRMKCRMNGFLLESKRRPKPMPLKDPLFRTGQIHGDG